MKKIWLIFTGILLTQNACDLQPRVMSFPDTVGEFISARYPALLADPNTDPEIYNSAVTDYGVYASPELYGTSPSDDYVVYASVDDYGTPQYDDNVQSDALYGTEIVSDKTESGADAAPMYGEMPEAINESDDGYIVVARGDTLYSLSKQHNTSVDNLARINNLNAPYQLSVGQKLKISDSDIADKQTTQETDVLVVAKPKNIIRTTTRVELETISVTRGDTLYSLSRKYSVPVNDLAVMNKLTPPFSLSVGQQLRVPKISGVANEKQTMPATVKISKTNTKNISATADAKKSDTVVIQKQVVAKPKKISSDPSKKLPTITARSSSKFSWPVRGKILSAYGAKSNGLFNDGINISAKRGTAVKAAENGVVAYAGNEVKGMGNLIIIQHSGGWMTVYAHMDSMNVKRGTRVNVGQKIGAVGETGKVDSPQLHFEIRKGTKAYNPNTYLK